jgi:hypothetical protein
MFTYGPFEQRSNVNPRPRPMSLTTSFPAAILETILGNLARLFLFGADGDLIAAHHAASQMVAAYHPKTEDELHLAADIISFGLHALEALSQAAEPGIPLNRQLRLRGSAVSLSREAHKSRRKFDQIQKARAAGIPIPAQEPPAPQPVPTRIDAAIQRVEATRQASPTFARKGGQNWTKGYQQREAAKRITENLKKNQLNAALKSTTAPTTQGIALAG